MSKLDLSELLHKIVNVATRIFLSCCMAFQPSECGNTHIQYQNDQFDQFLQMTYFVCTPSMCGTSEKVISDHKNSDWIYGRGSREVKISNIVKPTNEDIYQVLHIYYI